jgi:signal transduction histidine kinase
MHKRLIQEGFNRRYVLLPMLLAITLVSLGYWISETRRVHARELIEQVRERQDVIRLLTEAGYKAMEAESAQRGYLVAGEQKYLPPLETGLAEARERLAQLTERYRRLDPAQLSVLESISADLDVKAKEMRSSVSLAREGRGQEAVDLVKTDLGLYQMFAISEALDSLRAQERQKVFDGLDEWNRATRVNTFINTGNLMFTIGILLLLGLLVTRDLRRRSGYTRDLAMQIEARTAELRDLSRHMSRVAETEKHLLARELHDELGGLLVAMRMDIAQIRKRLPDAGDDDLKVRWERVEQALAQGLELKRRVIEDLRPTLLDNMGLLTALQWLASERSEQAQLALQMEGFDEDIQLPQETAIAVFRTAQEAIANVVKHAQASRLEVKAVIGERLVLQIADDGRGIAPGADRRVGSHGLRQMRFRMESVGGDVRIAGRAPRGTSIEISVPLDPPASAGS